MGSAAEQAATAQQLELVYRHMPDAIVAGGMARAAMYESLGYEDAPAFDLHSDSERSGYRDIDVLFSDPEDVLDFSHSRRHPELQHELDRTLGHFILRDEDQEDVYMLRGVGQDNKSFVLPLDPALMRPVERTLLGAPVRTLAVGTQLHIASLTKGETAAHQKSLRTAAEFTAFAAGIRTTNPEEFLPDAAYAPFDVFKQRSI